MNEFLKIPIGMMLINRLHHIIDMKTLANKLSNKHKHIPIILLSCKKTVYLNNKQIDISCNNISKIIDIFKDFRHIVFIAHRYASRCISYVSSDYTRHLTHQVLRMKGLTNFMQSLRICGVYNDNPNLIIYLPPFDQEKQLKLLNTYTNLIHADTNLLL